MIFEFDRAKSAANRDKHGISFEEARALWADDKLLVADARSIEEQRWIAIGMIEARHWTAIITDRDGRIRIISVRRSRENEIERYQGQ